MPIVHGCKKPVPRRGRAFFVSVSGPSASPKLVPACCGILSPVLERGTAKGGTRDKAGW